MNRKSFLMLGAVFALAVCAVAPKANAVPVVPGAPAVPLAGTTLAARPELAAVVLEDKIRPFSVNTGSGSTLRGWVQDRVVRTKAGTLDFYYRVYLEPSSTASFDEVIRDDFFPFATPTDCDWRIDGLGQRAPHHAWRNGDGMWVHFDHTGGGLIHPGESSRFVLIKTKAKEYTEEGHIWLGYTGGWEGAAFSVPGFMPEY